MNYQEEINLEFTLKNSQKDEWISYMASRPDDFPELIELSISDKQPYSWRAAWLLSSCMNNNDPRVKRYLQKIIDILPARQNSQQWSLLKVLQRMEIEPEYEGQLFDTCTIIWKNINNKPFTRFQAFKIMVAISKKYPDLSNEIILLTDPYYIDNLSYVVRKSVFTLMTDTKPKLIKTIYQEEINLEFTLKNSHKNECLSYITSHQEDFPELIELSISDKQPYSWRAAWLLSSCMDNNDQRVKRYLQKIIDILPARQNSQQWSLLKVLQRMEIEPEYEGQLFDTCTIIWKNINNKPFTRFQAFKIMVAISKKYPDLSNEIILLTDPYYTDNLSDNSRKSVFKLMDKFFS